jgi:hypothetical protein
MLVECGALDLAVARHVSNKAQAESNLEPPLWWVTWR